MDIYTLSKILGHSSVTITEQAYLDVTDADIKKRYSKFSPVENIYYLKNQKPLLIQTLWKTQGKFPVHEACEIAGQ